MVLGADAAADAAAVATIEDRREMNPLVQRGIEDAGYLAVADVEAALVGIGGHQSAIRVDVAAVYQHGEFAALAVDAE